MLQYFISPHNIDHGPTSMGLPAMSGQHDVVLPLLLMPKGHKRYCWPCHWAAAAVSVPEASSDICQLCHGFSACKFLFQIWASHQFAYNYWCLFWCMLSAFKYHAGCHIHQWGLNHCSLHHCSLLEHIHSRHMCSLVMVINPCQEYTKWCSLHCFKYGEPSVSQSAVF